MGVDEKVGRHTLQTKSKGIYPYPIEETSWTRTQPTLTGAPQSNKNMIWQVQTQHEPDGAGTISFVECGAERQIALHITSECPLHKCNGTGQAGLASGPTMRQVIDPLNHTQEEDTANVLKHLQTTFPVSSEIYLHIIINENAYSSRHENTTVQLFPIISVYFSLYLAVHLISARIIAAQY